MWECWGGTIGVLPLPSREAPTMPSPNVATILRDHVSLSTSCIDRGEPGNGPWVFREG